ncbi:MAG: lactate utilization protein [Chloroflexi bacterium]|nr:lactate utilization protein [Chloroflexota bacterium]
MNKHPARDEILGQVRAALGRRAETSVANVPASARVGPRQAGDANGEIEMLLGEIAKLGGNPRHLESKADLEAALENLVHEEGVKKATMWQTSELKELGVAEYLGTLGVEMISPHADRDQLADCDLGVTGVDAALPETGTLVLRSNPEKPRLVSLLPRVHLAILYPPLLDADLGTVLDKLRDDSCVTFITGPSRTSDIELTVTIGVHGPKALHVWIVEKTDRS